MLTTNPERGNKLCKYFVLFLLLSTTLSSIAQDKNLAQETDNSTYELRAQELADKLKPRYEVLSSMRNDLILQLSLPPQYTLCLFVTYTGAENNEEAHSLMLGQIDFLSRNGLTPKNITSLISYGHAILNYTFALAKNRNVATLAGNDFHALKKYGNEIYVEHSCAKLLSNEKIQLAVGELIQASISGKKK